MRTSWKDPTDKCRETFLKVPPSGTEAWARACPVGKAECTADVVDGKTRFKKLLGFLQHYKCSFNKAHFALQYLEYNSILSFTPLFSVPNNRKCQMKSYV